MYVYQIVAASVAADNAQGYDMKVYVVETLSKRWRDAAYQVEALGEVRYLLGLGFPYQRSLDEALDYVKGRSGEYGLVYDLLEVIYA
jgi:hypothetical protein